MQCHHHARMCPCVDKVNFVHENFSPFSLPKLTSRSRPSHLLSLNEAKELFYDCDFVDTKECADSKALQKTQGFKLIYAAGHLHVGGISLELYNADTGTRAT